MKIQSIDIQNFLGAINIKAELSKPITLFCGKNFAGKSSVRDAIALALTADLTRVSLKKDAARLITDGCEYSAVEITTSAGDYGVTINQAGKITDSQAGKETPSALPYVLNAQRFSELSDKERGNFLFGLMGVKQSGIAVKEMMLNKGLNAAKVEQILPFLKSGFESAHKESQAKARDGKASYKTLTGGKTWGKEKGGNWTPEAAFSEPDHIKKLIENANIHVKKIDSDLNSLQQQIGAAKRSELQKAAFAIRRQQLKEKAEKIDRIKNKLAIDADNLAKWQNKIAATRLAAQGEIEEHDSTECPCCGKLLQLVNTGFGPIVLREYVPPQRTPDIEAVRRLPEEEKAVGLLESAITNGNRDLAEAEKAAEQLKLLEDSLQDSPVDVSDIEAEITVLSGKKTAWQQDHDKYRDQLRQHDEQSKKIEQVAQLHAGILEWTAIADALAPDGIQSELLKSAITPINTRLSISAELTGWPSVSISDEMGIYSGRRPYLLLSESEQWRVDAMIAEAVSYISCLKFLVLDRVDVLDPQRGRADLFFWLDELSTAGEIETVLTFATLKASPQKLPDSIQSIWIENGVNQ